MPALAGAGGPVGQRAQRWRSATGRRFWTIIPVRRPPSRPLATPFGSFRFWSGSKNACREKHWRQFVEAWEREGAILAGRKSAAPFEALARQWKDRYRAWDTVKGLLSRSDWDPAVVARYWQTARETPEAESCRTEVDRKIKHHHAWGEFQASLPHGPPTEESDRVLVAAWQDHHRSFSGWEQAERERPGVLAAQRRLEEVERLRQAGNASPELATEQEVVRLGTALGEGYSPALGKRVGSGSPAAPRLRAFARFAARAGFGHRRLEVVAHAGQAAGPDAAAGRPLPQIALAERRVAALALLQKIPSDYPPEQAHRYDARLLACWKEDLLAECCDAQPWRTVYERAVQLEQHRSQLRNAVANGNPVEIAKAWVPLKPAHCHPSFSRRCGAT